jgi:streptomycin 6-kinase
MEKVQKPSNSVGYTPSLEPLVIYFKSSVNSKIQTKKLYMAHFAIDQYNMTQIKYINPLCKDLSQLISRKLY